jgi:hypothetical protein
MPDFHRTAIGKKFYESDLPSLVNALEKVAKQMEIQNIREEKKFKLDEKIMKLKLKNLNESTDNE